MREHRLELAEGDTISVKLAGYADELELTWDHIHETFLQNALNKVRAKGYQQEIPPGAEMALSQNVGFLK